MSPKGPTLLQAGLPKHILGFDTLEFLFEVVSSCFLSSTKNWSKRVQKEGSKFSHY